jgi:hypothetical protein
VALSRKATKGTLGEREGIMTAQKKYWYKNTATTDYLLLLSIMSIAGDMLMSFWQNEYFFWSLVQIIE